MSAGPVAVVTALGEEMRPLARRLRGRRRLGRRRLGGRLSGREAVLAVTGDGRQAARHGAEELLEQVRPRLLLGAGVAGALSPDLPVGSLLAARRVREEGGTVAAAAADWLARALASGRTVEGTLVTTSGVLASVEAKRRLWQRLGGGPRLAVDLESASWASAAERHGVPWLIVRAISDAADEDLPLPLDRLGRPDGGISRLRAALYLAAHPGSVTATLALGRRLRGLAARLADLLEELLA